MGGGMTGAGLGAGIAATNSAIQGAVAIKEANKAWKRQKTVLQNAIQWRVRDLKAAGLNPILAAQSGLGAGGAPSVATANLPDMASAVSGGARAGSDAARVKAENQRNQSTAKALEEKGKLDREASNTERDRQRLLKTQTTKEANTALQIGVNTKLAELAIPRAQMEADVYTNPITRGLMQYNMTNAGGPAARFISGIEAARQTGKSVGMDKSSTPIGLGQAIGGAARTKAKKTGSKIRNKATSFWDKLRRGMK